MRMVWRFLERDSISRNKLFLIVIRLTLPTPEEEEFSLFIKELLEAELVRPAVAWFMSFILKAP